MKQLKEEFDKLEDLISRVKKLTTKEEQDDEEAEEITIHCVTCGTVIQATSAIRHMERCYNKIESQTSFASRYKTQIEEERMFCDYYNRKEQSYCKRLQVLCPEHNPDPKISDGEVCGYPICKELFSEPTQFCLRPKKQCQAHFCWEKIRRAEIDMERVKQVREGDWKGGIDK